MLEQLREMIGQAAEPKVFMVEAADVARFCAATGDTCTEPQVPLTFPTTFRLEFPDFRGPFERILHAEQSYEYYLPLRIGQRILCRGEVESIYEKQGRSGLLTFIVFVVRGYDDDGAVMFQGRTSLIGQ